MMKMALTRMAMLMIKCLAIVIVIFKVTVKVIVDDEMFTFYLLF